MMLLGGVGGGVDFCFFVWGSVGFYLVVWGVTVVLWGEFFFVIGMSFFYLLIFALSGFFY
jgi:hypothetical protein